MKTHHSFEHGNVSEALPSILAHVMTDGEEVGSRQGERTKEILMPRVALWRPWEREVLVPGRKASLAAQIAETMWVLAGRNDVEWLSHYLPRAADFSDDGTTWTGGYGPRIRQWQQFDGTGWEGVDQLARVVDLLNNERGTRRAVINIYDPSIDSVGGKDVPCNNWLSFISRNGKLHMNVATRSNDVMWGWSGINQFEWSVLQEIIAFLIGNQIGTLTFNVTSMHVYEKHWEKAARIIDAAGTSTYDHLDPSPRFGATMPGIRTVERLDELIEEWFEIEKMIREEGPDLPEVYSAVNRFSEPMMRSWLWVIQYHWSNELTYLSSLHGTRLYAAAQMSPPNKVLRLPDAPTPEAVKVQAAVVSPMNVDNVTIQGEVPPNLLDMLRAHEGMSIRLDDHHTAVVGPVEPRKKPGILGMKPEYIIQDEPPPGFSTRGVDKPLLWTSQFVEYVDKLHREKSAVYGDSWKRRGELIAILANVARKVDRLGEGGAGDTAADTVIDLLVYLAKYALWLNEQSSPDGTWDDENEFVLGVLQSEDRRSVKVVQAASIPSRIVALKEYFEQLIQVARTDPGMTYSEPRMKIVDHMISLAFPTARYFWGIENGHILSSVEAAEILMPRVTPDTNATRRWEGYEVGENID